MISVTSSGSWAKTSSFLAYMQKLNILNVLNHYGQVGVAALSAATPIESGLAAASWYYKAGATKNGYFIDWYNSDVEDGYPVVIGIQYGHGTRGGGYVQGQDFINPAMRPIFDEIIDQVWKAVTSA